MGWIDQGPPYPWGLPQATALRAHLVTAFGTPREVRTLIESAGRPDPNRIAFEGRAIDDVWRDTLECAAEERAIRRLLEFVCEQDLHPHVIALVRRVLHDESATPRRALRLDFTQPHRFDLEELVARCRAGIAGSTGPVGFTVQCGSEHVMKNLTERIRETLRPAHVRPVRTIGGIHGVDPAVRQVRGWVPLLATDSIVCRAIAIDRTAAEEFWRQVLASFCSPQPHRLVVFLQVEPIEGLHSVATPVFQWEQVEVWCNQFVSFQNWKRAEALDLLVNGFAVEGSDELDVDHTYERLQLALDLLRDYPDEVAFINAWTKRIVGHV